MKHVLDLEMRILNDFHLFKFDNQGSMLIIKACFDFFMDEFYLAKRHQLSLQTTLGISWLWMAI